jgi:hypothetical protein
MKIRDTFGASYDPVIDAIAEHNSESFDIASPGSVAMAAATKGDTLISISYPPPPAEKSLNMN